MKKCHVLQDTMKKLTRWSGDEHDYWDFEDKFYANDKEENEKKLLAERECKIRNLKETIESAQKELKKLENL